ncbi:MAG TPA: hypothetical protein VFV65_03035 [Gemmatimonadales bacterium]|nr:hypothetical protein [Gemmatimonadales bacterium]
MLFLLLIPLAASLALITYLRLEPKGPRMWVPMACRAVAWAGLGALVANPGCPAGADARAPLVLLDASLSMSADSAGWARASDTARTIGRVRWFGDPRPWTDSLPIRGRSDLAPALASAVSLGRRIVVVTDGELGDGADLPPELARAAGFVVLPRVPSRDLAIVGVSGPPRATVGDTLAVLAELRLDHAASAESVTVAATWGGRTLGRAAARIHPGTTVPVLLRVGSRALPAGTQFLRIGVVGATDAEPRDDARLIAVTMSATPGVVVLARPGDWDARFLYRTLRDVAGLPVKGYVELAGERWHDMDGLAEVPTGAVRAAARGADLLVVRGEAPALERESRARGLLRWPSGSAAPGEWYATSAPASPVGLAFLGVPLESLPPATGLHPLAPDSGSWVGLTVQAGRRGAARPVIVGRQAGARREVTVGAEGLWRWALRGGPSGDAYRAMMAAAVSWLLGTPESGSADARVVHPVVEQGMPLVFARSADSITALPVTFEGAGQALDDTLRFSGDGRALVWLPPGIYRYRLGGSRGGAGVAAVDTWSREWLPQPATVAERAGPASGLGEPSTARQWPWLYALVLLAFAGEWLVRRRLGLR